jgi:hypothetical protein
MMCQACSEGRHWDCGLQTWCACDCDPEMAGMYWPGDDDNPGGHSLECTCETCIQNHPERMLLLDDDDDECRECEFEGPCYCDEIINE